MSISILPASAYATTSGGEARKFIFTSACTLPSKLRLPESTEQATKSPSVIALLTGSGIGPEFPIQVVQPYPTVWKPKEFKDDYIEAAANYVIDPVSKEFYNPNEFVFEEDKFAEADEQIVEKLDSKSD